jgi:hypothetical protein
MCVDLRISIPLKFINFDAGCHIESHYMVRLTLYEKLKMASPYNLLILKYVKNSKYVRYILFNTV